MPLPFGLKAPSKGTLIFSGIAGAVSGIIYTSSKHAEESRKRLTQQVAFLAERPCGVHEMPRKVTVYISAPPGDSLEKSRNWFREYVKPILVAGAVDYEVKEAKSAGQIESSVIEEVVKRRREAIASTEQEEAEATKNNNNFTQQTNSNNPFASPSMETMLTKKKQSEGLSDGILAIGRNAYREVLSGLSKGCGASLAVIEEVPAAPVEETVKEETQTENIADVSATNEEPLPVAPIEQEEKQEIIMDQQQPKQQQEENHFSLPPTFSPVIYIPHVNIIGWSNIPYRLYMWYADYQRIDEVGKYAVAAVLNQTRPIEERDADLGQHEKKYWIGDETAEVLKQNDTPIVIDERIFDKLSTYTSDELP